MQPNSLVEPAFSSLPTTRATLGPEVAELATVAGFPPDPEQRLALDVLFGVRRDGRASAFEFALICSRQNMKTGLFKMAALGWLFVSQERLIVWSAHEMKTTKEAFLELVAMIENTPVLAAELAGGSSRGIHRGNGDESIELADGRRIMFKARTSGGGRGLSGDKVILDEAFALQASHMGSLLPTLSARPDPQVVYGSSAGRSESEVLRGIRDRGRKGGDPALAYLEWCDDMPGDCQLADCLHGLDAGGCKLDDEDRWRRANPALGRRITLDYVRKERRALPPAEFARERLGWWDDPIEESALVPIAAWNACESPIGMEKVKAFGVEVSLDRMVSSIAAAGRAGAGMIAVESIDRRHSTSWVVDRCIELNKSHGPATFVIDGGGPAASLIPAMQNAGLSLTVADTRDIGTACAMFVDAITDGKLCHGPQPELESAVLGAKKRPLGDGAFAFGRKASTGDITPLVAVALAHWSAREDRAPEVYSIRELMQQIRQERAETPAAVEGQPTPAPPTLDGQVRPDGSVFRTF